MRHDRDALRQCASESPQSPEREVNPDIPARRAVFLHTRRWRGTSHRRQYTTIYVQRDSGRVGKLKIAAAENGLAEVSLDGQHIGDLPTKTLAQWLSLPMSDRYGDERVTFSLLETLGTITITVPGVAQWPLRTRDLVSLRFRLGGTP